MTTTDDDGDRARSAPSPPQQPCNKARDLFAAAADVFPVPFNGSRVHLLLKSRDPWALAHGPPPPVPAATPAATVWSAASAIKLFSNAAGSGMHAAGTLGFRSRLGWLACGTVQVNPVSGNWSFESVVAKGLDGSVDVAAAGQVCAWTRPLTCTFDLDHAGAAGTALSVTVDVVKRTCAFQCLQAVTRRLSLGAELRFSRARSGSAAFRPALMARYAGPAYLLSAKANPAAGAIKLAWYRHNGDRLQTSVVLDVDRSRSVATAAMAFRVLAGRLSSVRAAAGTDGVVCCQLERRLADGVSASLSARYDCKAERYGLGAGLSFG